MWLIVTGISWNSQQQSCYTEEQLLERLPHSFARLGFDPDENMGRMNVNGGSATGTDSESRRT